MFDFENEDDGEDDGIAVLTHQLFVVATPVFGFSR